MDAVAVLIDAAGRPAEAVHTLRDRLTAESLNDHPGGHDNSVAWLLWHTGREIDAQLAELSRADQLWHSRGFRERFALGPVGDGVGYGHTPAQARSVVVHDLGALLDYLDAVTDALRDHLRTLTETALDEVVDERFDPPVTRGARLVSIIDDAAQHVGQIGYAAGIPSRFGD